MLKRIAVGVAAIGVVLVVVVALQPAEFAVERSATIEAPPHLVYGYIENLREWEAWSPFARMDPKQKNSYAGPAAGVGAVTSWEGPEAGKGRATITAEGPRALDELWQVAARLIVSLEDALAFHAPQPAAKRMAKKHKRYAHKKKRKHKHKRKRRHG